ncbi:hypothetical protein KM043_001721 [Ampulex compressa]|nr:hypothetical protein KM043_001721 [Ampulex compressa]
MYVCDESFDTVLRCPYNINHKIARSRIQRHLVKCEKNYPVDYKVICPYNASHRLFKSEVEEHIIACPMRSLLKPELYQCTQKHGSTTSKLQSEISSVIDCDEDWNADQEVESIPLKNNSYSHRRAICLNSSYQALSIKTGHSYHDNVRAPRGYSEVMLKENTDNSCIEDMTSVTSSMGVGRGRTSVCNEKLWKMIALGRGKPLN